MTGTVTWEQRKRSNSKRAVTFWHSFSLRARSSLGCCLLRPFQVLVTEHNFSIWYLFWSIFTKSSIAESPVESFSHVSRRMLWAQALRTKQCSGRQDGVLPLFGSQPECQKLFNVHAFVDNNHLLWFLMHLNAVQIYSPNILINIGHRSHSRSWSNVIISVPEGYCKTTILSMIFPTVSLCLEVPRYSLSTPWAVPARSFCINRKT